MTTEQRVSNVEEAIVLLAGTTGGLVELNKTIVEVQEGQQRLLDQHQQFPETQQQLLGGHQQLLETQQQLFDRQQAEVAEYRRDVAQYRRLWIHLARKYGWFDGEDWPPPEDPE